jgi:hypothetical protein
MLDDYELFWIWKYPVECSFIRVILHFDCQVLSSSGTIYQTQLTVSNGHPLILYFSW